jgi:hypothetical protein
MSGSFAVENVLSRLRDRAGLDETADWPAVVLAVAAMPYGRPRDPLPLAVLSDWRGTCSSKHYLLASALSEGWPALEPAVWHRLYRLDASAAAAVFGPAAAAAVPGGGLTDVHTYLKVRRQRGEASAEPEIVLDATFAPRSPWDGEGSMALWCGEGSDVAGGTDPAAVKARLVALHCDSSAREPFIASLSCLYPPRQALGCEALGSAGPDR